jgi:transcriptional regulator with XRE-family HTH domain
VGDPADELHALGLAIRIARKRAGLSQDALADLAGLHRTYVGSVERGERNISLLNIHALARALQTTASELVRAAEAVHTRAPTARGRK